MNKDWFGVDATHPAPRMAELIEVIRAFLHAENGERVRYEGRFYTIDADIRAPVLGRLDVPILIGAFNKIMVRTVGRTADGVLGHGVFTDRWWTELVEPELARGAEATGRDPAELRRWGWLITAIDNDDPARAVRDARLQIAFYSHREDLRLTHRTARLDRRGRPDSFSLPQRPTRNDRRPRHRRYAVVNRDLRRRHTGARNACESQTTA